MPRHPIERRSGYDLQRFDEILTAIGEGKSIDEIEATMRRRDGGETEEEKRIEREARIALRTLPYVTAIDSSPDGGESDLVVTLDPETVALDTVQVMLRRDRKDVEKFTRATQQRLGDKPIATWLVEEKIIILHGKMEIGGMLHSFGAQLGHILHHPR